MPTDEPQTDADQTPQDAPSDSERATGDNRYQRSTIAFPYTSIKDAEQIAKKLHDDFGGASSPDELSGSMNQSPKAGAFRIKVSTARIFGVVTVGRRNIALSELGRRLVDPQAQAAARVDAFLHVPLFAKLVEEYRGALLPPDAGLEQKISVLGVSSRQTAKARQAFQRSAEIAGFFKHGRNRLIQPTGLAGSDGNEPSQHREEVVNAGQTPPGALPAPLADLWVTLLREGGSWSSEQVEKWIAGARMLWLVLAAQGED